MLYERYAPRLLIYDISTGYDLAENNNMTYVNRLKLFSDNRVVIDYITDMFPIERLKILS